jgi:hypothetical protein
MPEPKISVDDIVAAAGAGAMRAMDSRRLSDERISMEKLVGAGFGVRFEIWAGGFPGPWGPWGSGGIPGGPAGGMK